jgi:hypothetical protein
LCGVFRAVDLGQQYDKVPRVGGNFSFDIDTFVIIIIRCITLGVVSSSIFPSRLTLFYSTPWNSHVWPAPNSTSGSSLRGVVTRFFAYSSNCYSFLGARRFQHEARHPPKSCRTFRKICDRLHHRTSVGRPAQGFSLTKLVTTTTSISSSAPARLNLGLVL